MSDRKVLAKGFFWSAVEKYSSLAVGLVISMILARLLTPKEFGTVAIATVIIQFLYMVSSMGIGPAIIQRKDLTELDLDNIFTFSCLIGLFLASIFFLGSWSIARIYEVDALVTICQILSIQVFFAAANMVPNALMTKNLRFKEIAKRTFWLHVITGTIAIIAALLGAGLYALLISPVFTAVGIFLYNRHFYKVSISKKFSIVPIKKIFSYSSYQFLFQFVAYFSANIDKLLIGKYISASDLGYYQKSDQLIQQPLNSVAAVVAPVLQPVLSKYQNDIQELGKKYNKVIRMVATIAFPIGVFMFSCGSEIIRVFYGSQWDLAIPTFKIMSIALPFQLIINCTGGFFQAGNDTKSLFNVGLINACISISLTCVAVMLFNTIEAVAIAWAVSRLLFFIVTYAFMYVKILKLSFFLVFKDFSMPVGIALFLALLLFLEGIVLPNNMIPNIMVKGMTSALVVVVSLQVTRQVDIVNHLSTKLFKNRIIKSNKNDAIV